MDNLVKGHSGEWEVVIGMEVHAQVTQPQNCFRARQRHSAQILIRMFRW